MIIIFQGNEAKGEGKGHSIHATSLYNYVLSH